MCSRLAVHLADFRDGLVSQRGIAVAVRAQTTDGRPCLGEDAMLAVEFLQLALLDVRVHLNPVDRRNHVSLVEQALQTLRQEVAPADGAHLAV